MCVCMRVLLYAGNSSVNKSPNFMSFSLRKVPPVRRSSCFQLHVCVYVCMHVRMYVCMYVRVKKVAPCQTQHLHIASVAGLVFVYAYWLL